MKTEQFLVMAGMIYLAPHMLEKVGVLLGFVFIGWAALIGLGVLNG